MKAVFKSFIDVAFLKNHKSKRPYSASEDVDSPELENWKSINRFILQGSAIGFFRSGVDAADLQDSNPIAFALLNDYWQGKRQDIEIVDAPHEQLVQENRFMSVFFFTDEIQLGFSPAAYGFVKYDSGKVQKRWLDNPAKVKSYLVSRRQLINTQLHSWNDFQQFSFPTNSVIVFDNYVFRHRGNIAANFVKLLEAICPDTLSEHPLDILVVTKFFYGKDGLAPKPGNEEAPLKEVFREVDNVLKTSRKIKLFNLTIVQKAAEIDETHDRNIVTSYLRIMLTNSLSFFDRNGQARMASDVEVTPVPHIRTNGSGNTFGDICIGWLQLAWEAVHDHRNKICGVRQNQLLKRLE